MSASHTLRILIVEDEPVTSMAMKRFLEFEGHQVAVAASEEEAVTESRSLKPNVVVSDWKLRDGDDGLTVARRLQSEYHPSIIMVTAHRLETVRGRAREMGLEIAAFRRKPVSLAHLAELLDEVV